MKRLIKAALIAAPLAFAGNSVLANDWTGFYVGGSLGYGDIDADDVSGDFEGVTFGGHVGYNHDFGEFVLGAELEAVGTNDFTLDGGDLELDSVLLAKVRAGYDAGAYLPYVTAGVSQATIDVGSGSDLDDNGVFYGLGLDYALSDVITIGGEYLRHEFDNFDGGDDIEVDTFSLRVSYKF